MISRFLNHSEDLLNSDSILSSFQEVLEEELENPVQIPVQIQILPETVSTNRDLYEQARCGGSEWAVLFAEKQTQGRGRLGRVWESPPQKNLTFSILLRPRVDPAALFQFNFVAGLALYETFLFCLNRNVPPNSNSRGSFNVRSPLFLKWPNDLFCGFKKMAGILAETGCSDLDLSKKFSNCSDSSSEFAHFVVIGVGMNIRSCKTDFSLALQDKVTSLFEETGVLFSRSQVAGRYLAFLSLWYQRYLEKGFLSVCEQWQQWGPARGTALEIQEGSESFSAVYRGLDSQGFLLVETSAGSLRKIVAADCQWRF